MFKQLANKTSTGNGTFEVLDRPLEYRKFRGDKLNLRLSFSILAGALTGADLILAAEDFCENTKASIYWRDGDRMVEDCPLRVLEWVSQIERRGYADALVECIDKTVVVSTTTVVTYDIEINLAQPLFERPTDFSQALSQIGRIVIKPGATGKANLTVTGVQVIVTAHGEQVDYFHAGIRKHIGVQPSDVSKSQQLPAGGYLAILGMYSLDNAGSPIDADGPNVEIDGAEVVDAPDISALELQWYLGSVAPGALTPARSALTQTLWATLMQFEAGASLGKLPKGEQVRATFQANVGTAQDQNFALVRFVPKTAKARRQFPGGLVRTPSELAADTVIKRLSSGDLVPAGIADYLPERVETPEAVGAAA